MILKRSKRLFEKWLLCKVQDNHSWNFAIQLFESGRNFNSCIKWWRQDSSRGLKLPIFIKIQSFKLENLIVGCIIHQVVTSFNTSIPLSQPPHNHMCLSWMRVFLYYPYEWQVIEPHGWTHKYRGFEYLQTFNHLSQWEPRIIYNITRHSHGVLQTMVKILKYLVSFSTNSSNIQES